MASRAAEGDEQTRYEIKYDPTGDFDQYREYVQRTMEKPYPDNGGFYGMGSLQQMGLRRSRHEGDFRDQSEFKNREESYKQPLKGLTTMFDRGTNIRGEGGVREPSKKTAEGEAGPYERPREQARASVAENIALIRSLGGHITIPSEVAERRRFESELRGLHKPDAFPGWDMKFAVKLFQTYQSSYPGYRAGIVPSSHDSHHTSERNEHTEVPEGLLASGSQHDLSSAASSMRPSTPSSGLSFASSRRFASSKKLQASTRSISTALALKIDVKRGEEIPKMDATGVTDTEGCDAYVVLRYDGQERFRTKVFEESYSPVWNETFILDVPRLSRSSPLVLQVWDSDELQDEMIGQCNINFFDLLRAKPLERWYTMTAESAKAFQAVQEKEDTSHAGRVLLVLTLDFAHAFDTHEEEESEEIDTTITKPHGEIADTPDLEAKIGRMDLKNKDSRKFLLDKLSLIRGGINYTSKPDLFRAVDSFANAQSHQARENLLEARQLVEQAIHHAHRVLKLEFVVNEDTMLAAKVLMAALASQKPTEKQAVSDECRSYMRKITAIPEMVSALDDELAPSDPDRKIVRSSNPDGCACTENQPGARSVRHRMLADIRCITQAVLEELTMSRPPPCMWRPGRENTTHPGPDGREVDNELELLSTSNPFGLRGHYQPVNAVAFYQEWIFSASSDKSIRVWDMSTFECVGLIDLEHRGAINCLAVGPGGFDMMLYSGSSDETIKAYNISPNIMQGGRTIPCVHTIPHHSGPVTCLCIQRFYPKSEYSTAVRGWRLYSGSADRTIKVFETAFIGKGGILPDDPQPFGTLSGHKSTVTAVTVARGRLFSGSLDTTIRVWDCESLESILSIALEGNIINSLNVSFGRLYVATSDRKIHVYTLEELRLITKMEGHTAYVACLASARSRQSAKMKHLLQNRHPVYERPNMAGHPLTFDSYDPEQLVQRFVTLHVSIRKARDLEASETSPDSAPYVRVTLGGPVRISGREHFVEEQTRRTKIVHRTLNPRWNESFTFVMPELPDYRNKSGSSVRQLPVCFDVWDWKIAADHHLGQWKGTVGDCFPEGPNNVCRIPGADGTGEDGEDRGGWVFLEPRASVVGRDLEAVVGLKVGMSEEGMRWMAARDIPNVSEGRAGYISSVAEDGSACRVLWEATIGKEKEGILYPKGWESHITYSTGRLEKYYLMKWDERPHRHGELMLCCHVTPTVSHEDLPLEPHRSFLFSGSDDETIRVWDVESHTCVAVLDGQHENKVSHLAVTPSGRLLSASQDSTVCVW